MVAVTEQQSNFVDRMFEAPGFKQAAKAAPDAKNATIAITSLAGIDYYADAKLRGLIQSHFKIDINAPLLTTNTPGLNILKKKDLAYGAIAGMAAMKNKKAGLFLGGAVLLKRWLESRGAVTAGNDGLPRGGNTRLAVVRP